MRVSIDLDTAVEHDREILARLFSLDGAAPKPQKKPKPVEPVGNPDAEKPAASSASVAENTPAAETVVETAAPKAVTLKADAPAEIVKLAASPTDKEVLGKAILKCSKPVEEGGRTRAVAVGFLEKFRPAGFTEPLVKVGVIDSKKYGELAALILNEYRA